MACCPLIQLALQGDCLALVFGQTVCIQPTMGGFGHTSHTAFYLPLTFPLSYIQMPLTPMLELFWSRLSGLLHFLAANCQDTECNYSISDHELLAIFLAC